MGSGASADSTGPPSGWLAPLTAAAPVGDRVALVGRGSADPAPEPDRRSADAAIHQISDMSRHEERMRASEAVKPPCSFLFSFRVITPVGDRLGSVYLRRGTSCSL
jgi:hypothetical protein